MHMPLNQFNQFKPNGLFQINQLAEPILILGMLDRNKRNFTPNLAVLYVPVNNF